MEKNNQSQTRQFVPDTYRFVNLGLFLLVAITNNIPYQSLTGIAPVISDLYQVSALEVNFNQLFFAITYVLLIFPSNYLIDVKGLKISTVLCQILLTTGLALRCLINVHFYFFLSGSLVCALGYCIILSAANKFPNIWFLEKQILPVKSLVLFCLFTSDTLGIYLSSAFINQNSTKDDVQKFFIIQSGIMILFNLLNVIFFKGKPKNLQNYASQVVMVKESYMKSLKLLFTHKNYIKLFLAMTFFDTTVDGAFVCFSWLGQAYSISTEKCAYIFVIANATGFIGCALTGFIYPRSYKKKCQLLTVFSLSSFSLVWVGFQMSSLWVIYLASALMGINLFPLMMTLFDFSAQTAFPIGEATSGGSFIFGSSTLGFVMVVLFSLYINDSVTTQKCRVTMGTLVIFQIIGFLILHLSKQDLNRTQYEQKMKSQQKQSLLSQNSILTEN